MRLQVEKGMLWAENLLVSSSVRKSFFIAVCPDSIASVIRQQSPLRERVFPGSAFACGFEDTPVEENFEIA